MKTLISGSAGLAIAYDRPEVLLAIGAVPQPIKGWIPPERIFDGAADLFELGVKNVFDAQGALEAAWRADRALRLTLMLLDAEEPDEDLGDIGECLNDLLADDGAVTAVERAMAAKPLNGLGDISRALDATAAGAERARALLERLVTWQGSISRVSEAFSTIRYDAFPSGERPETVRWSLINRGAFLALVQGLEAGGDLSFVRLQLASKHPTMRELVARWVNHIQPKSGRMPRAISTPAADPDDWVAYDDMPGAAGYQVLAEVRERQQEIRRALKDLNVDLARRLTKELIDHQRPVSSPDQVSKSLCFLAQAAKAEEVPSLQVEWARWASEENPVDPRTFAHLADAHIRLREFDQALAAFDQMENVGELVYPAVGRARILRLLGQIVEARDAYLRAAAEFTDFDGVEYAEAGAAECLRDLGKTEEAVAEYRALTNRWPMKETFWNGLASVLMDAGRFDEAITIFGQASKIKNSPVSKNGRATVARLSGRFSDALSLYAEVLQAFPNNTVALGGRADALRGLGKYDEALTAYTCAIARVPETPQLWVGKANLLNQMGRRTEALELSAEAIACFPSDHHFRVVRGRILKAMGRWKDALGEVELALKQSPDEPDAGILRAELLYHLGEADGAHVVLDGIIAKKQHIAAAVTAKVAILLAEDRVDDADRLLTLGTPRTQWDWSRYLLRGEILARTDRRAAYRHLSAGTRRCPFARQRAQILNALVALELSQGRFREARQLTERSEVQVSNVVQLHVFAASHRPGRARAKLEAIRSSEAPFELIQLADEIARRHRLLDEKPVHSQQWIHAMHRRTIALDAVA